MFRVNLNWLKMGMFRYVPLRFPPCAVFFHGVSENYRPDDIVQVNQVSFESFKTQIDALSRRHTFLSLSEMLDHLNNGTKLPENALILSFDDGYENNFLLVHQELRRRKIKYSVFVCPNLITQKRRVPTYYLRAAIMNTPQKSISLPHIASVFPTATQEDKILTISRLRGPFKRLRAEQLVDVLGSLEGILAPETWQALDYKYTSERLMSWDQIQELSNDGVEIGSHTLDHMILHKNQNMDDIDIQIKKSRELLSNTLKKEISAFCYPNGTAADISARAVATVKNGGYAVAFVNFPGPIDHEVDRFLVPRYGLVADPAASIGGLIALKKRSVAYEKFVEACYGNV